MGCPKEPRLGPQHRQNSLSIFYVCLFLLHFLHLPHSLLLHTGLLCIVGNGAASGQPQRSKEDLYLPDIRDLSQGTFLIGLFWSCVHDVVQSLLPRECIFCDWSGLVYTLTPEARSKAITGWRGAGKLAGKTKIQKTTKQYLPETTDLVTFWSSPRMHTWVLSREGFVRVSTNLKDCFTEISVGHWVHAPH